jgi:hypothetical protein
MSSLPSSLLETFTAPKLRLGNVRKGGRTARHMPDRTGLLQDCTPRLEEELTWKSGFLMSNTSEEKEL